MAVRISKKSEITCVSDLAVRASSLSTTSKVLFRGQNTDKPLAPKISRHLSVTAEQLTQIEREMLDRFKKESTPFLSQLYPGSDWDWLSIAQHQGMPTRLLDWSANALAALWFAVASDPPEQEPHGVLWCLKVDQSDLKSPDQEVDIFSLRRTYVFQPFHIDRRISAQSSWFSVHKYIEDSEKFIPLDQNKTYKDKLTKFIVPRAAFPTLRRELRVMGVTQATLFPDLSGLSADIQEEFLGSHRDADKI